MLKQGDIIKVSFDPQIGHEQAGYRPALIVSTDKFTQYTTLALVCPISNTKKDFPMHVDLDDRTQTTGAVFCEHIRSLDLKTRHYRYIETVPDDILYAVLEIIKLSLGL